LQQELEGQNRRDFAGGKSARKLRKERLKETLTLALLGGKKHNIDSGCPAATSFSSALLSSEERGWARHHPFLLNTSNALNKFIIFILLAAVGRMRRLPAAPCLCLLPFSEQKLVIFHSLYLYNVLRAVQ
jgi:hypothetical protein